VVRTATGAGLRTGGSGVGSPVAWTVAVVMAAVLAGCASRADLLEIERRMDTRMQEQARSIHDVQLEVERIRAATEGRAPGAVPRAGLTKPLARKPDKDRGLATDKGAPRIESPSQEIGMTLAPEGTSTGGAAPAPAPAPAEPSPAPAEAQPGSPPSEPHSSGPPPHPAVEESWKREVEQDRAVASTMNVSERAEYMGALARLAKGDCAKAAGRLNAVSSDAKGSPLADNALYWQARCDAARGNNGQAESRYRDIVARYPKGDKAPAALWEQGKLLMHGGDASAARGVLSRLIHDYPSSSEAAQARRALASLEH
jgi:TolA-binding protein